MTRMWLSRFAFALGGIAAACGPSHPTDAELFQRFYTHDVDFVRFVAMPDSNAHVVRIVSAYGLVRAVGRGTTAIKARCGEGAEERATVEVVP
jgi:hypothetical protein